MVDNPLTKAGVVLPVLTKANALRRRVHGRVASIDLIQWNDVSYGDRMRQHVHMWELNDLCPRDGWPATISSPSHPSGLRQRSQELEKEGC